MSTVLIQPFNVGGSSGPGKNTGQFSDNFTRANTSDWGPNWAINNFESGGNVCNLAPTINANLGRMIQVSAGSPYALFTPVPLLWLLAQSAPLNHFSQAIWKAVSNTTSDFYVACQISLNVFATAASTGFYAIQRANSTGALTIQKVVYSGNMANAPAFTTLSNLSGATSVSGDTLRLEARISVGVWTLNALKNGTSLGTITDSTFLYAGMPGMATVLTGNGQTQDVSNYSGGLL